MNKPIRTVAIFCLVLFMALMANVTWLQYGQANELNAHPENRRVIEAAYSRERGAILVGRDPIAESKPVDTRFDFLRTYPQPYMYGHLTGFFSFYTQTGIERSQNEILSGDDSMLFVDRLVDLLSNESGRGGSVRLTVDPQAQQAAWDGLQELGPGAQASVVAVEPATGRILAMASVPSFDPNEIATHDLAASQQAYEQLDSAEGQPLLNRAIQNTLPPGSTFKLVTAAAAIEEFDYSSGSQVPGGSTYQLPQTTGDTGQIDNEGRSCGSGTIPFTQAMSNSCNTTFAALGVQLGGERLQEQAEAFGFNDDTYLEDLSPLATSVFPEEANDPQAGQSAIGQYDVRATPLQMAMVAAGIANQGTVMRPYVVEEVLSPEFDVLQRSEPGELSQAISAGSASELTDLMVATVNEGTASPAAMAATQVAGKTGTAQSGNPDNPPYAWFTSFAPAQDAQVAVAVQIQALPGVDRGEIAGGQIGGPIAKRVMEAVIGR